jgi:hypothetical protein
MITSGVSFACTSGVDTYAVTLITGAGEVEQTREARLKIIATENLA